METETDPGANIGLLRLRQRERESECSPLKQSTNKGNYFSLSFQSWENNLIISNLGTSLARIDGVVPRGVPNYIQTTREILIIIFNCLDYLETWNSKRNRIFNNVRGSACSAYYSISSRWMLLHTHILIKINQITACTCNSE